MANYAHVVAVTIANGAQASNVISAQGLFSLYAIEMPAAFTGTAIKVFCSTDPINGAVPLFANMDAAYSAGADISITVAAGKYVILPTTTPIIANWIAIQSQSAELAARTVKLLLKAVD